jgi:FAD linked oxidases, C-terminal domain
MVDPDTDLVLVHVRFLVCADDAEEAQRAVACADAMVAISHAAGGTCTGEHGIGYGKLHHLEKEHGAPAVQVGDASWIAVRFGSKKLPRRGGGLAVMAVCVGMCWIAGNESYQTGAGSTRDNESWEARVVGRQGYRGSAIAGR